MYVDAVVPKRYISECRCCGCEDTNTCCCDFISVLNNSYWAAAAHKLYFEINDKECCPGDPKPCNGKLHGVSGCLQPDTQANPDFCETYWRTPSSISLISECGSLAPINITYNLYCQTGNLGVDDKAINPLRSCNHGFRWRLVVNMSNSSCDQVPNGNNVNNDVPYTGYYLPFAGEYRNDKISPPICQPTGTCPPPNLGNFQVSFRVEAPYNRSGFTQCGCCTDGDHYIFTIKLDQSKCATQIGGGLCS